MTSILPDPEPVAATPRRPSAADEQAAQWQAIANLSPAALHRRISMCRSALQRVTDPDVRLVLERCLDGWYEA